MQTEDYGSAAEPREELTGSVETITYRNDANGYTVLQLSDGRELITVVGILPTVSIGEELFLSGQYETHRLYGRQFHALAAEQRLPASADEILKYLSSGAIKGIGPATALKIVETFGENALTILEKDPGSLSRIRGISRSKADEICAAYARQFGMREAVLRFSSMGITASESMRIYKAFGSRSVERITENPYLLCRGDLGFSFEHADRIARFLHIESDSEQRICSGIVHVLRHNLQNGHTCLPREKVEQAAAALLSVSAEKTAGCTDKLCADGTLTALAFDGRDFLALPYINDAERYIAGRLEMLLAFPPAPIDTLESDLQAIESVQGITYDKQQRRAITDAVTKGLLILTGGPGTGKTTTLKAIITVLMQHDCKILTAAPTGRAAKRMTELTGVEAKTIHRLLEVEWGENDALSFARNEKNPLKADAVIIDELSMVDVPLFDALLRALPLGCRLIMVGDPHQLPAVGAGNVLADLIACEKIPTVSLSVIFRQSMDSLIVTNAHRIVNGEHPDLSCRSGDFFLLHERPGPPLLELVCELCAVRLPEAYGFNPFQDIQVLCPSRKTASGTSALNLALQARLNPAEFGKREASFSGLLFREGDKVMQIKNNYDIPWTRADGESGTGIFNGDIGILQSIDRTTGILSVRFDDRIAVYSQADAMDLELAYAVTVHKSQGSEYPCVILPVAGTPPLLCYRNLLYTGVTRARKMLLLIGSEQDINTMVDNHRKTLRYTALRRYMTEE